MKEENGKTEARFKLRSIFLFVNLTVLFLPLFGVIFFRFYENQLIKQTESELISQAAVLGATYKQLLRNELEDKDNYGYKISVSKVSPANYYNPVIPQTDLFISEILPPRPDGISPESPTQFARTPIAPEEEPVVLADNSAIRPATSKPSETRRISGYDPQEEDTITVVGSRVKGRTALDSNVPVDVIQAGELNKTPLLDLADTISIPSSKVDEPNELNQIVAEDMLPIIIEAQKTTLSGIKILDAEGTVTVGRNEVGLNFSHLSEVKTAMSGDYVSLLRERISDMPMPALASISRGTGIRLFAAFPIIENDRIWGIVYLSRTPQNILKHIYDNKEKMTLIAISLIAVTLLLALLTSYTVSKPMNRLIDRIKRFTEGEIGAIEPMSSPGVKEIEQLSKSFAKMAHTIHDRAQYIRQFAMSVSHEFKTPITSIQGSAELLLEHLDEMEVDKKNKFLQNIVADSDRLKRLITRLLELAKADSYIPENEITSLNQTLTILNDRYDDLDIEFDGLANTDFEILMAQEHMETIFTNLFDNALQNGATKIAIKNRSHYGFVILTISDNGDGISASNKDKIFESFFTTKRENGGTGLGLGIVKSLLGAHNGAIFLKDYDQGACFEITLPTTFA